MSSPSTPVALRRALVALLALAALVVLPAAPGSAAPGGTPGANPGAGAPGNPDQGPPVWTGVPGTNMAHDTYGYPWPAAPDCDESNVGTGGCVNDGLGFFQGQCTSWVAFRLGQRNGLAFSNWFSGVHWGDAADWAKGAKSIGMKPNEVPAVGAVGWYARGHVSYVESVNTDGSIVISEMNTDGHNGFHLATVYPGGVGWPDKFIHLADVVPVDYTAPEQPGSPAAVSIRGGVKVSWKQPADDMGVTGYTVRRDGVEVARTATPSYVDRQASPGQAYSYTVTAADAAGNVSSAATARVELGTAAPARLAKPYLPGTARMVTFDDADLACGLLGKPRDQRIGCTRRTAVGTGAGPDGSRGRLGRSRFPYLPRRRRRPGVVLPRPGRPRRHRPRLCPLRPHLAQLGLRPRGRPSSGAGPAELVRVAVRPGRLRHGRRPGDLLGRLRRRLGGTEPREADAARRPALAGVRADVARGLVLPRGGGPGDLHRARWAWRVAPRVGQQAHRRPRPLAPGHPRPRAVLGRRPHLSDGVRTASVTMAGCSPTTSRTSSTAGCPGPRSSATTAGAWSRRASSSSCTTVSRYGLKASGPSDGHLVREIRAHDEWLVPWTSRGCVPVRVASDVGLRMLLTRWLPGDLVQGSPAATDPATYRQAGALLALLHDQPGDEDPDLEHRANARSRRWLDGEHRLAPEVERRVRDLLDAWDEVDVVTSRRADARRLAPPQLDRRRLGHGARDRPRPGRPAPRRQRPAAALVAGVPRLGPPGGRLPRGLRQRPARRRPRPWHRMRLREGVGTAVWALQVGDEPFEQHGHAMIAAALADC